MPEPVHVHRQNRGHLGGDGDDGGCCYWPRPLDELLQLPLPHLDLLESRAELSLQACSRRLEGSFCSVCACSGLAR